MLEVRELHTYFGKSHVLQGVSFDIKEGEVVGILGRNGAGKTTTLRSVMGIDRQRDGSIVFNDRNLIPLTTRDITRLGLAYVPEDRRIFAGLTVRENLEIAARPGRWHLADVFDLFPPLALRARVKGRSLSGGEQQMLAIARALMTNPQLMLLDEPCQGLAPVIVEGLIQSLLQLKAIGISVLLVEQSLDVAVALADRDYIIEDGRVVYRGDAEDFKHNVAVRERFLSV